MNDHINAALSLRIHGSKIDVSLFSFLAFICFAAGISLVLGVGVIDDPNSTPILTNVAGLGVTGISTTFFVNKAIQSRADLRRSREIQTLYVEAISPPPSEYIDDIRDCALSWLTGK